MKSGILPTMEDYLMKLISLNIVLKQAIHETKTNTILDLGINTIRSIVLPVQSPEKEKNIIAAKIEKLPAFCNQLEKPISQHQTSAEQLMPTVLKVAFSYSSSSQATANTLEGAGA
jgi:predicted glycosyltransferase